MLGVVPINRSYAATLHFMFSKLYEVNAMKHF